MHRQNKRYFYTYYEEKSTFIKIKGIPVHEICSRLGIGCGYPKRELSYSQNCCNQEKDVKDQNEWSLHFQANNISNDVVQNKENIENVERHVNNENYLLPYGFACLG